jgi:hypothetical protein
VRKTTVFQAMLWTLWKEGHNMVTAIQLDGEETTIL